METSIIGNGQLLDRAADFRSGQLNQSNKVLSFLPKLIYCMPEIIRVPLA